MPIKNYMALNGNAVYLLSQLKDNHDVKEIFLHQVSQNRYLAYVDDTYYSEQIVLIRALSQRNRCLYQYAPAIFRSKQDLIEYLNSIGRNDILIRVGLPQEMSPEPALSLFR